MENPRTTSARDHDDHEMIDAAVADPTPGQGSTRGGSLAHDVATQAELAAVSDPEVTRRPKKTDKIDSDQARSGHRGGAE
jgi:hypothetical protein